MRFYSLYSHGPHGRGGGGRRSPKGFSWVYQRHQDFFRSQKTQGFGGFFLYLSLAQINPSSYKHNLLLVLFFGYAKKVGIFWSIKYEPQSALLPVIKISEWGPWVSVTCIHL